MTVLCSRILYIDTVIRKDVKWTDLNNVGEETDSSESNTDHQKQFLIHWWFWSCCCCCCRRPSCCCWWWTDIICHGALIVVVLLMLFLLLLLPVTCLPVSFAVSFEIVYKVKDSGWCYYWKLFLSSHCGSFNIHDSWYHCRHKITMLNHQIFYIVHF